jgi:hypothetical protein
MGVRKHGRPLGGVLSQNEDCRYDAEVVCIWRAQYISIATKAEMMLARRYRTKNGRVSSKMVPPMIEPNVIGRERLDGCVDDTRYEGVKACGEYCIGDESCVGGRTRFARNVQAFGPVPSNSTEVGGEVKGVHYRGRSCPCGTDVSFERFFV